MAILSAPLPMQLRGSFTPPVLSASLSRTYTWHGLTLSANSLHLGLYRLDKTNGEILEVLFFGASGTGDPGADGEDLHFPGINQLNIPPGIDLGICLSRAGGGALPVNILHGEASADSPDVSYGNAEADFTFRHNTLLNVSETKCGTVTNDGVQRANLGVISGFTIGWL